VAAGGVAIESGFVLLLGAAVTGVSWLTFRRLAYLESLLILCAACQRVGELLITTLEPRETARRAS